MFPLTTLPSDNANPYYENTVTFEDALHQIYYYYFGVNPIAKSMIELFFISLFVIVVIISILSSIIIFIDQYTPEKPEEEIKKC